MSLSVLFSHVYLLTSHRASIHVSIVTPPPNILGTLNIFSRIVSHFHSSHMHNYRVLQAVDIQRISRCYGYSLYLMHIFSRSSSPLFKDVQMECNTTYQHHSTTVPYRCWWASAPRKLTRSLAMTNRIHFLSTLCHTSIMIIGLGIVSILVFMWHTQQNLTVFMKCGLLRAGE